MTLIMKKTDNKIEVPIRPQERLNVICEKLHQFFDEVAISKQLHEMIKPWENYCRGYNKVAAFNVKGELKRLDAFVKQQEDMLKKLKKLNSFNTHLAEYMQLFHLGDSISTNHDDAIRLIQRELDLLIKNRSLLLMSENSAVNQESLESAAIMHLFVLAEKKYGLKPGNVGRGNLNQIVAFAMIISDHSDEGKIRRLYEKHRQLKQN